MLHIVSSLLTVLTYTSFSLTAYPNANSNNPSGSVTFLDGTSNVVLNYRSSQVNLDGYVEYNYYNSRVGLLPNQFDNFPLETHYVALTRLSITSLSDTRWFRYTYGDSYSGTVIPLYNFDFQFNVYDASYSNYVHRFTISKIGNGTTNPRRDYYNAVVDISIIGYSEDNLNFNTYSATFNLSDTFKEGGYSAPFALFGSNAYSEEYLPRQWLIVFDFHLQDREGYADYYENLGFEDAYDDGYETGYAVGEQDGYATGRLDGFAEGQGSHYSFKNLFGVLIDTPIIYLRKMFDYELFGISVFKALATVISLIVALSVFRLVRGIF